MKQMRVWMFLLMSAPALLLTACAPQDDGLRFQERERKKRVRGIGVGWFRQRRDAAISRIRHTNRMKCSRHADGALLRLLQPD